LWLSGGERQRAAIAQAPQKDAPILSRDEAMASVDPENEAEIPSPVSTMARPSLWWRIERRQFAPSRM